MAHHPVPVSLYSSLRDRRKQREQLMTDPNRQQKRERLVGWATGHGKVPRRVLPQQESDPLPCHEEVYSLGLVRLPGVVVRDQAQVCLVGYDLLPRQRQDLRRLARLPYRCCCCEVALEVDEKSREGSERLGQILVIAVVVSVELWWVLNGTKNGRDQMLRAVSSR